MGKTGPKSRLRGYMRKMRGLTLIETALALGVMSLVVASLSMMMADSADQTRAKAAADKVVMVHEAAKGYLKANHAALLTAPGTQTTVLAGRTSGGGAVPAGSLQEGGFLPASFVDTNGYGQRHALQIRRTSPTQLEAIVTTYGGRPIADRQLGRIANSVGAAGGYVADQNVAPGDAGQIVGSYGGWRAPAATWSFGSVNPVAGTVQATLAFDNGQVLSDYLYRNDIGIPEANRMNTNIDMAGNDLNNVDTVRGQAGNLAIQGNTVVTGNLTSTIDVWASRDLRVERNAQVDGHTSLNTLRASGQTVLGHATAAATSGADLTVHGPSHLNGATTITGAATINGATTVNGTTTLNGATTVNGLATVTNDAQINGELRSTRLNSNTVVTGSTGHINGITLSDMLPKMVPQYSYRVTEVAGGQNVYKPRCNGGTGRARIMVHRQTDSNRANPVVNLVGDASGVYVQSTHVDVFDSVQVAHNGADFWNVRWIGNPHAPSVPRVALAQTYCYYGSGT